MTKQTRKTQKPTKPTSKTNKQRDNNRSDTYINFYYIPEPYAGRLVREAISSSGLYASVNSDHSIRSPE